MNAETEANPTSARRLAAKRCEPLNCRPGKSPHFNPAAMFQAIAGDITNVQQLDARHA